MLSSPVARERTEPIDDVPRQRPAYADRERSASVGRWLVAVAVLAVLTVVVTIAINMFGSNTRDVQVPDVSGQPLNDAIATLQNRGFKTEPHRRPDSEVPTDHVINTEPAAGTSVGAGDEITINVSMGPKQAEIPDVRGVTFDRSRREAHATPASRTSGGPHVPSMPEQKDTVIETNPPVNQTSAITNEITIIVGSGPDSKVVPDCMGQTVDDCSTILNASGFQRRPRRSGQHRPAGQVIGTNPPAAQNVPVDTVIQIQVSQGISSACRI